MNFFWISLYFSESESVRRKTVAHVRDCSWSNQSKRNVDAAPSYAYIIAIVLAMSCGWNSVNGALVRRSQTRKSFDFHEKTMMIQSTIAATMAQNVPASTAIWQPESRCGIR
eukprot:Amastigsp_a174760_125.p7 type:complete len:112 gc:universal Amastigsp_a174760_125:1522-1187(-)